MGKDPVCQGLTSKFFISYIFFVLPFLSTVGFRPAHGNAIRRHDKPEGKRGPSCRYQNFACLSFADSNAGSLLLTMTWPPSCSRPYAAPDDNAHILPVLLHDGLSTHLPNPVFLANRRK